MLEERQREEHQVASQSELRRAGRKKTRRKRSSNQQQQQQQQQQKANRMQSTNANKEEENSPVHIEKLTCSLAGHSRLPKWILILSLTAMMILASGGRQSSLVSSAAAAAEEANLSKLNSTTTTTLTIEKRPNETVSSGNKTWQAGRANNNVLCNSRVRCVLLEYWPAAIASNSSGPARSTAVDHPKNATETLIEFTADYELTDDHEEATGELAGESEVVVDGNSRQANQTAADHSADGWGGAAAVVAQPPAGNGPTQSSRPAALTAAAAAAAAAAATQNGADQSKSGQQSGRADVDDKDEKASDQRPDHNGDVLTATNPNQQHQQREANSTTTTTIGQATVQDGARLHSTNQAATQTATNTTTMTTTTTTTTTASIPLDHRRPLSSSRNNHNNHHHHHQPLEQRHHQVTAASYGALTGGHLFALPSGHPQEQQRPSFLQADGSAPAGASPASSDQYRQTATGPQLYAQSLYSNSAPKLSFHAHSPHYLTSNGAAESPSDGPQQASSPMSSSALESALVTPSGAANRRSASSNAHHSHLLKAIAPLKSLVLANGSLTEHQQQSSGQAMATKVRQMLEEISCEGVQSLDLSGNHLQFELFTELYALLIVPMRSHLFHLNLAHNSLVKLGVTFTGFIEHSLILAAHHQHKNNNHHSASIRWPFAANNNSTLAPSTYNSTQQNDVSTRLKPTRNASNNKYSGSASLNSYRPQPRLGDGHHFNLVVSQMSNGSAGAGDDCKHLAALYLSNTTLMSAMMHQFALLRGLDLSHNKLKWLINDQFRTLKYVQSIRLDHNRLRYIHQQAFNGLENLKYLNLNHNRLQTIYVEQFQTNYNLLALMLRANYLAYLRAGSFAALTNLRRLDLSQNKFTISSNNAFVGLESLRLLNFSSNQFIHAPSAALHPLVSLERFDLSSNQIAQLSPGAFFHLPIEELWLDDNDQLVAIDRGAFWDLPYLRRLHLRWNPMLASINSQAFVGVQNLQLIEVDGCPALEGSARQMLENITIATTSRQLRVEQQQEQQQSIIKQNNTSTSVSVSVSSSTSTPPVASPSGNMTSNNSSGQQPPNRPQPTQNGLIGGNQMALNEQQTKQSLKGRGDNNLRQYAYSLGLLTLLVVALKLVFKYTSTSYYLEARRRAKRVYEVRPNHDPNDHDHDHDEDPDSTSGGPIRMQLRTCEHHFFRTAAPAAPSAAGVGCSRRRLDQLNDDESCSIVSNSDGSSALSGSNHFHVIDANNQASACSSSSPSPSSILSEPNEVDPNDESTRNRPSQSDGFEEVNLKDDDQPKVEGDVHVMQEETTTTTTNIDVVYCPECPQVAAATTTTTTTIAELGFDNNHQQQTESQTGSECCDSLLVNSAGGAGDLRPVDVAGEQQQQQQQMLGQEQQVNNNGGGSGSGTALELIHSQLVAAGFDYGHANCLHFYQSLGPALQFADLTANFVNQMDYY